MISSFLFIDKFNFSVPVPQLLLENSYLNSGIVERKQVDQRKIYLIQKVELILVACVFTFGEIKCLLDHNLCG